VGSLTVRVVPRSTKVANGTGVEVSTDGIVVRVRAAPEGGRATEEARKALAAALGTPVSGVTLRRGRRSREKVFELAEMTEEQALQRLRG
jgi:uncharacterized protein YggU (UPF0235/DUF167 family)